MRLKAPIKRSSMRKICLLPSELQLGMYVCELDRPWVDSPFLFQGFPLNNAAEIKQINDLCDYVYVDKQRSNSRAFDGLKAQTLSRTFPPVPHQAPPLNPTGSKKSVHKKSHSKISDKLTGIDRGLEKARPIFFEARQLVRHALDEVRLGHSVDLPAVHQGVADCANVIIHHPDAMLLLSGLKNKDDYTAEHSLNVAVLSMVLGHHLDMPRFDIEALGVAAMLHDVGKMHTPETILKKPGKLSDEELQVMRQHPELGTDILGSSHGISDEALAVAHDHHERLNGSGYPRNLSDNEISHFAKIVSITDSFDAITSNRVYGRGRTNVEAFQILQASSGNLFQSELVSKFIHAIGIYTPGTTVQLRDGNYAVIMKSNPDHPWRPIIMVLRNAELEPIKPRYLDLTQAPPRHHIRKMVRTEECGLDPELFRWRGFEQFLDEPD